MILITGATGFIGSRLAENFHSQGRNLVLLGRVRSDTEAQRSKRLLSLGLQVAEVDLAEHDLAKYIRGVDAIIHLAAAQHEANQPESYFEKVNVVGTRRLLEAAIQNDVRRFIYGSTIGIYGNVANGQITDQTPALPDNHYGRTKLIAEKVTTEFSGKLEVVIARISETYGPGDFRLLKLFSGIKKRMFFIIGSGENKHQLVYVDDLIEALQEMLSSAAAVNQVIVLAGDEVMTTRRMCQEIAESVQTPLRKIQSPIWPFFLLAVILENTLGKIGIQPPLHRRRLDFFRKSLYFASDKRNRILDWRPKTSFLEGTQRTAKWYSENDYLNR